MTEQARKARNEYRRKWYSKNKDKAKAINERYWAKKAAQNTPADADGKGGGSVES